MEWPAIVVFVSPLPVGRLGVDWGRGGEQSALAKKSEKS